MSVILYNCSENNHIPAKKYVKMIVNKNATVNLCVQQSILKIG